MMAFYNRKSPRIPHYDYKTANYYFITICTFNHRYCFGSPEALNEIGKIAERHIQNIEQHYRNVKVDQYVVMPNHVHMILVLESGLNSDNQADLNQIVAQYKSGVSREVRTLFETDKLWQRSFHDHVIRDQKQYEKIWLYIETNPQRWDKDCFYMQ